MTALARSKSLQMSDDAIMVAPKLEGVMKPKLKHISDKFIIKPIKMLNEYVAVLPVDHNPKGDVWVPTEKPTRGVVVGVSDKVKEIALGDIVQFSARTSAVELEGADGYDEKVLIFSISSLFTHLGVANFKLADSKTK